MNGAARQGEAAAQNGSRMVGEPVCRGICRLKKAVDVPPVVGNHFRRNQRTAEPAGIVNRQPLSGLDQFESGFGSFKGSEIVQSEVSVCRDQSIGGSQNPLIVQRNRSVRRGDAYGVFGFRVSDGSGIHDIESPGAFDPLNFAGVIQLHVGGLQKAPDSAGVGDVGFLPDRYIVGSTGIDKDKRFGSDPAGGSGVVDPDVPRTVDPRNVAVVSDLRVIAGKCKFTKVAGRLIRNPGVSRGRNRGKRTGIIQFQRICLKLLHGTGIVDFSGLKNRIAGNPAGIHQCGVPFDSEVSNFPGICDRGIGSSNFNAGNRSVLLIFDNRVSLYGNRVAFCGGNRSGIGQIQRIGL